MKARAELEHRAAEQPLDYDRYLDLLTLDLGDDDQAGKLAAEFLLSQMRNQHAGNRPSASH